MSNPNKNKTHCPKGHPLKEGNLVLSELKRGRRRCRTCRNAADKKRRNPDGKISPTVLNKQKTHCKNGHPLEGDNLLPSYLKRRQRVCKICKRIYDSIWVKTPKRKLYVKEWQANKYANND